MIAFRLVCFAALMLLMAAALVDLRVLAVVCVFEAVLALMWAWVLVKARGDDGRA